MFHFTLHKNIELRKSALVKCLQEHNKSILKSHIVIITIFNAGGVEASMKINFFQTGSVVFQGIHCAQSEKSIFFKIIQLYHSKYRSTQYCSEK